MAKIGSACCSGTVAAAAAAALTKHCSIEQDAKQLTTRTRRQPLKDLLLPILAAASLSWSTTNWHQFNFLTQERSTMA